MKKALIPALLLTLALICLAEDVHPITHRRIAQVMGSGGPTGWCVPNARPRSVPTKLSTR